MSADPSNITVADRARRAAENIDRIANAATGDQPAALQFETPLRLVDQIDYDMLHVCDWVERRRGADTAASLRGRTAEVLTAIHKPPRKARSGALILDLFAKARQLAYSLRRWAEDIETEDSQPVVETPAPGDGPPRPRMTVQTANQKAMELAKKMKRTFFALSQRVQAILIGCSWQTWAKTPFYQVAKEKAPPRKVASRKAAVSLTDALEAVTAEGGKDEVLNQVEREEEQKEAERQEQLQRLIGEQTADRHADEGRKFRPRKRL
jgi:hypothetical protein